MSTENLPDALDLMARALRAGHSVGAAIEIVAQEGGEPLRSEFKEVYKQQSFGLPQRDALLQLGRRVPSADLQIVITAMLVQKETGGNLVDILERTTAVLRDRMRIQGELRVRRCGIPGESVPVPRRWACSGHNRATSWCPRQRC